MQPLYGTAHQGLPDELEGTLKVAAALGLELLPWQRHAISVLSQRHGRGYRYPVAVVSTPRQSGKTTMLGCLLIYRLLAYRGYRGYYTAQSLKDARYAWSSWVDLIGAGIGLDHFKTRLGFGVEQLQVPSMNSTLLPVVRKEQAMHGRQSDTYVFDECWELLPDKAESLIQAVQPTQATRPNRQLLFVSTAGTDESIWFRDWVRRGREATGDPAAEICHLEWACPEDLDPCDATTWHSFHPGLGGLIEEATLHSALDLHGPDLFARAYGNCWPKVEQSWRGNWAELASAERIPNDAPVVFGCDAEPGHQSAAIVAAWLNPEGVLVAEVVDSRPNTDWLLPRLAELTRKHQSEVAVTTTGPLAFLIPEGQQLGIAWTRLSASDYANSVARLKNLVREKRIAHPDDSRLNSAVDNALTKQTGDRETWRRLEAKTSIAPLVALSVAAYQATTPKLAPVIMSA